ncbi:MAG: hypothetical protein ACD_22C00030G0005 [uncultured bacterium]|nr:MAG: hypothetical protein ACD_22C00030G0005 [uncultured bacterium]
MQKTIKVSLVSVKGLIGVLYQAEPRNKSIILLLNGGPGFGDNKKFPHIKLLINQGYDLFIPDYYGSARSFGDIFSFSSCLETISVSEQFLTGQLLYVDETSFIKKHLKYLNIILLGSSWGASTIPSYFKNYTSSIKKVFLVNPVTSWGMFKSPYEEELDDTFLKSLTFWWNNHYRNVKKSDWVDVILGKIPEKIPLNNLKYLKGKKILITHGNKDKIINWHRSLYLHQKLLELDIDSSLMIFKNCKHGMSSLKKTLEQLIDT